MEKPSHPYRLAKAAGSDSPCFPFRRPVSRPSVWPHFTGSLINAGGGCYLLPNSPFYSSLRVCVNTLESSVLAGSYSRFPYKTQLIDAVVESCWFPPSSGLGTIRLCFGSADHYHLLKRKQFEQIVHFRRRYNWRIPWLVDWRPSG